MVADRDRLDHDYPVARGHHHEAGQRDEAVSGHGDRRGRRAGRDSAPRGWRLHRHQAALAGDAARIWGDDQRYVDTYWSKFGHMYLAGDGCRRDEDGDYWFMGRIDDVMNVSGHRISTTEVESALVDHPAVAEAAVVGKNDDITGQAICCYVSLKGGEPGSPELADELRAHVATKLGRFTMPKYLVFTHELPKTRSGKIMRRLLRDIAEGRTLGDTTTLADSSVVATLQERAKGEVGQEG